MRGSRTRPYSIVLLFSYSEPNYRRSQYTINAAPRESSALRNSSSSEHEQQSWSRLPVRVQSTSSADHTYDQTPVQYEYQMAEIATAPSGNSYRRSMNNSHNYGSTSDDRAYDNAGYYEVEI